MRAFLIPIALIAANAATAQTCNPPVLTLRDKILTYESPATDVYASGGIAAIVIGDGPEPRSIDVGTTHHVPHRRRLTGTAHVHDGLALAPLIPGQLDPIHRDHRHVDPLLSHPENAR